MPRQKNVHEVLAALQQHHLTQQELVTKTGLSRATVTRIVGALMERQLIDSHKAAATGGNPPDILSIRPKAGAALSIDFGKSHIRVVVRDLGGDSGADGILSSEKPIDVPEKSLESLDEAVRLANKALERQGVEPENLVGVCVGLPAAIDQEHGRVAVPGTMPDWTEMQPAEELKSRLLWDVPMLLDNDANLAAIAEHEWGAGKGHANVLYVKWAAGIGGGIIVDGELVRGGEGLAGEFGHNPIPGFSTEVKGSCPSCGHECLESIAGGRALADRAGYEDKDVMRLVAEARRDADGGKSRDLLREGAEHLGRTLGPVITNLNPSVLIIGGAFSREKGDYNLIANGLRGGLEETALPAALEATRIDTGMLTGRAAALGGISLVLREQLRSFLISRV